MVCGMREGLTVLHIGRQPWHGWPSLLVSSDVAEGQKCQMLGCILIKVSQVDQADVKW
jgi:hypothetical protein